MTSIIKVDQIQNAAGTAGLTIDSNGIILKSKVPAFKAEKTAQQTTTANNEVILFQDEIFDQGGNFANNTFTCPVDGVYFFSCLWLANTGAGQTDVQIRKNNVFVQTSRNAASTALESTTLNHVGRFVAGDEVTIVAASSGAVIYGDSDHWSTFMGYLIG